MAQQGHSSCAAKYLFSDPCEWLMIGTCPWQLNILSEKIARSCSSTDRSIRCPSKSQRCGDA